MHKDILIQCLKTLPIGKGKIIVDVTDIKEIDGYGWDFSLTYRSLDNPFEMNEISFHNWITKETYHIFKEQYTKNDDLKKIKLEELIVARTEIDLSRRAYDDFIAANSTEVEPTPQENPAFLTEHMPIQEINITAGNYHEWIRMQENMKRATEIYQEKVRELQQL